MTISSYRPSWVFIDTGGYFGLASSKDEHHSDAVAIMRALISGHFPLFTSNFILAELHALLLTRISRRTALETLNTIDNSSTTIVRVSQSDENRARQIIAQYDDKNFSLTEATFFAIMDRLHFSSRQF
jgi:uncharacterized protein